MMISRTFPRMLGHTPCGIARNAGSVSHPRTHLISLVTNNHQRNRLIGVTGRRGLSEQDVAGVVALPQRYFSQSATRHANGPSPPRGGFPLGNIFGQQPERKPGDALKEFGIDLTEKAKKGELDPCIGRTEEIKRSIQILSRRTKVCLHLWPCRLTDKLPQLIPCLLSLSFLSPIQSSSVQLGSGKVGAPFIYSVLAESMIN